MSAAVPSRGITPTRACRSGAQRYGMPPSGAAASACRSAHRGAQEEIRCGVPLGEPGQQCRDGLGRPAVQIRAEVQRHRKVVEHDILLGQREVVHHRLRPQADVDGATHLPVDSGHRVLHDVSAHRVVGDRVQFTGQRVALGVGGVSAEQRAAEVGRSNGFQFVGQLVGTRAGLDDGQRPAALSDDVGVRGEVEAAVGRTAAPGLAQLARDVRGAHPPVAVPVRLAVAQPQTVRHARRRGTSGSGRDPGRRSGSGRSADSARRDSRESCR